jgi:hypothetical protein
MPGYKITAYSPSTTQEIRELELDGNIIQEAAEAQYRANTFAQRLNGQNYMQARDWQGRVEPI